MNKLDLLRQSGKLLSALKIDRGLLHWQEVLRRKNYLRAVIYHDTPAGTASPFEKQLRFYQKHFSPVSKSDLDRFFQTGRWHKERPGLMLTFDDGFQSNFEVALPLLEQYGFTGWFFIPVGWVNQPDRMSWEEIRRLGQRHVIGCHTRTHRRMVRGLPDEILQDEIAASKKDLEEGLGRPVDCFGWVGGELPTYTGTAHALIKKAGYRYAFMTNSKPIGPKTNPFFLERTYAEPHWSVPEITFMISGVVDWLYRSKRKKVARNLA
ncbi:MAG: polysaccharide deacetylase family protein [Deltaproteobacteria bacterium]|nr:polysaccharide deacetylase family protein [Deltaproteobacteria bacterium]MBI4223750.1 polysaccharide deacetylase family protein [Deltaproteobacteria bacterium]